MAIVLLDTNVLSELVRPRPEPAVVAFLSEQLDAVISAITIHELTFGAERAPVLRRARLLDWIDGVRTRFSDRIIPVTSDVATEAGRLRAAATRAGYSVEAMASLIAASAHACNAILATRNVRDFRPMGVPLVDPWNPAGGSPG